MNIEDILKAKYSNLKPSEQKIDYSFQELGIEIETYFGKSKRIWAMFHKVGYTESLMRYALKECQNRGVTNLNYFEAIIRNKLKQKTT